MTQKLLTLPLRLGFGAARTAIVLSARVAGTAIQILRPSGGGSSSSDAPPRPTTPAGPPPAESQPSRDRQRSESRTNGRPDAPAASGNETATSRRVPAAPQTEPPAPQAEPPTPPAEQPDTPLSPTEDTIKTIDDEPEVVAEFADRGAEEGAGAQLDVDEPWEGYSGMNADAVIARIGEADAAALAVIELFERTHKQRQTVLAAAERRLRALSPPSGRTQPETG